MAITRKQAKLAVTYVYLWIASVIILMAIGDIVSVEYIQGASLPARAIGIVSIISSLVFFSAGPVVFYVALRLIKAAIMSFVKESERT